MLRTLYICVSVLSSHTDTAKSLRQIYNAHVFQMIKLLSVCYIPSEIVVYSSDDNSADVFAADVIAVFCG